MRRTIVELTPASVRLLQVERRGRALRVQHWVSEPLASEEELPAVLARLGQQAHPARAPIIAVVPRERVVTRLLSFPATREDEVAQMVAVASKAQLPYPPEQAVVDFHIVEQRAGSSIVQVMACQRAFVERYLEGVRRLGDEVLRLVPSSWGLVAWAQQREPINAIREPVLLLNVDRDHTDVVVARQHRLLLSRSLPQGSASGPAEQELWVQEVERSLSSLRRDWAGLRAPRVVLTGLEPLEPWRAALAPRLNTTIEIVSATSPRQTLPSSAAVQGSPVVVLGLAAGDPSRWPNLLPPEIRRASRERRRARASLVTGGLVLASLALGAWVLSVQSARQRALLAQFEQLRKRLETQTRDTERQQEALQVIDRALQARRQFAETLDVLLRAMPGELLVETLAYEQGRSEVVLRGTAPTTRHVLDYVRALEESGRWSRVTLRYSTQRKTPAGWRVEFEVVAQMGPS